MSQVYVRCCKTTGQSNLTHGKEYERVSRDVLHGTVSVRNNADMVFAYDSNMFSGEYTHGLPKVTPHKWAKEIHAWAEGHKIDCWNKDGSDAWVWAPYPTFSSAMRYRIQPVIDTLAIATCKADLKELSDEAAHYKRSMKIATDHYKHTLDTINIKNRILSSLESGDKTDDQATQDN